MSTFWPFRRPCDGEDVMALMRYRGKSLHVPVRSNKRCSPLGRTFGFLRVLNQGDDRRPFAIVTQLKSCSANAHLCTPAGKSSSRTTAEKRKIDRERERERNYTLIVAFRVFLICCDMLSFVKLLTSLKILRPTSQKNTVAQSQPRSATRDRGSAQRAIPFRFLLCILGWESNSNSN